MLASIIVCTYNRAASLADTLAALKQLSSPDTGDWEVLVVDNNSKDDTRSIVEKAVHDWPRLRYAFQPQQGLSHARNLGIAESRGETLLFTDDDVLPEPDWLVVTLAGLERHGADACGGYIAPIWEAPPPAWLTERFYGLLAVRTDREDDYPILDARQTPFGANMALRRAVLERIGGFDTTRGRVGTNLASGEDGELFERLLKSGGKAVFLGRSRVHHKVEAHRCTKRYLRRWRFQTSRNLAQSLPVAGNRRIANIPFYFFPQLLRALGRATLGRLTAPPDEAFFRDLLVWHLLGTMHGLMTRGRP